MVTSQWQPRRQFSSLVNNPDVLDFNNLYNTSDILPSRCDTNKRASYCLGLDLSLCILLRLFSFETRDDVEHASNHWRSMFGAVIYLSKLPETMWSAIEAFFSTLRKLAQRIDTSLLLVPYHSSCLSAACRYWL